MVESGMNFPEFDAREQQKTSKIRSDDPNPTASFG
jgi:hypothetical protein